VTDITLRHVTLTHSQPRQRGHTVTNDGDDETANNDGPNNVCIVVWANSKLFFHLILVTLLIHLFIFRVLSTTQPHDRTTAHWHCDIHPHTGTHTAMHTCKQRWMTRDRQRRTRITGTVKKCQRHVIWRVFGFGMFFSFWFSFYSGTNTSFLATNTTSATSATCTTHAATHATRTTQTHTNTRQTAHNKWDSNQEDKMGPQTTICVVWMTVVSFFFVFVILNLLIHLF
jgi:hypothetical protein